jgi:hypothetical protein
MFAGKSTLPNMWTKSSVRAAVEEMMNRNVNWASRLQSRDRRSHLLLYTIREGLGRRLSRHGSSLSHCVMSLGTTPPDCLTSELHERMHTVEHVDPLELETMEPTGF